MAGLHAPGRKPDDLAVAVDDLAREDGGPVFRDLAHDRFDDHFGRRHSGGELLEIAPVRNAHVRHRPYFRRIDQPALVVEQVQTTDMWQRREFDAQHLVRAQGRHLLFKFVGAFDHVRPHIADDVVVNMLEIAQLLVEMPRQQQRAVVEFALGDLKRALAELQGEITGAEHDRDHEARGGQNEPLDRAQSQPGQRVGDRSPHASRDDVFRWTALHFSLPPRVLLLRGHNPRGR